MRIKLVLFVLFVAGSGAAVALGAEDDAGGRGLFSYEYRSPVVVTPGAWLTHGFAQNVTESQDLGKVKQNANLLATADLELRLPGRPWLGFWARGGQTVANRKADSDTADDVDSDFMIGEVNLVVSVVGRGSPFFDDIDTPRSRLDLYVGGRYFREDYEAEMAGGVHRETEAIWVGPQLGVRGEWCLQDTYDVDALRGWSVNVRGAVLPWMHMESTDWRDGVTAFESESNRAYGGDAAAGFGWRKGPVGLGLGFEAQFLRTDGGDEEDALGVERRIESSRSIRYGLFAALALYF